MSFVQTIVLINWVTPLSLYLSFRYVNRISQAKAIQLEKKHADSMLREATDIADEYLCSRERLEGKDKSNATTTTANNTASQLNNQMQASTCPC